MDTKKSKYSLIIKLDNNTNILFNTIYGTADILSNDMKEKWASHVDVFSDEERKYLTKRGHLVLKEDELRLINEVQKRHISLKEKKSKFYIIFSYTCNLGCYYCFENNIETLSKLSFEKLDNVFKSIKKIIEFNKTADNEIVLFGGEPLLLENKGLIIKTFSFAKESNLKVSVITNGVNIEHFLKIFIDNKNIINSFSITIDGNKRTHDSRRTFKNGEPTYNKILEGINLLTSIGINVSIRMNIDPTNGKIIEQALDELVIKLTEKPRVYLSLVENPNCSESCFAMYNYLEVTKLLYDLGYFDLAKEVNFNININSIKQIKYLLLKTLPTPRFKFCRMSELYVFSPNGKIYNCPQACDNDKLKVGEYWPTVNIIQNTIQERHAFSALKIDTCKECSLAPICGGGCYIKRIHSPETICYKSDLINSLKYILKRILQMNTKSLES